jgi:peptide/nickel transport system substrate-binding protein
VLVNNPNWWGKPEHNLTEVVFTPIGNDATRMSALVSGEVDMMEPVPLQDAERLKANPALKILQASELRTVFIGLDVYRDELLHSSVKGKNPLKDKRVRQALYQAIDIETIRSKIMRGAAAPAGMVLAPGIRGYEAALDKRLPYSVDAAKQLLTQAGYPEGFELGLQCPNDRYVNDAEICQAVAAMWSKAGVKTTLSAETKTLYLPKALKREVTAYMLGWQPAGNDGHNPLWALLNTPAPGGQGQFNLGRYSNPKLDDMTQKLAVELDPAKRAGLMREAWKLVNDDIPVLPLHNQQLSWGAKRNVELVQQPDNSNPLRFVNVR